MGNIDLIRSIPRTQLACSPFPLSAVRHIRRLNGSTQAHLMEASDGGLYAVKFQNNPQSARALASEFLASRLGSWLGLPMPQVEVIQVSDWLVNHDLLRIETDNRLTRCASGRQLAFRYIPDALESLPRGSFHRVTNSEDFIQILPFDKWTANCDNRQAVFVKQGRQYQVIFIDQHQCFDAGRWGFPNLPHHGTYEHRQVYREVRGWQWFEPTLSRIEKISRFDLWKFATEIPPEWFAHDTQALSRLIERLYKRRGYIRDLIANLHDSGRNLFPNWPRSEEMPVCTL
jgi:hypothetical protein